MEAIYTETKKNYLLNTILNNETARIKWIEIFDRLFNVPVSIIITDNKGRVVYLNSDYANFLEIKQLDAIGKNIVEVVPNTRVPIVLSTEKPEISKPHTFIDGQKSIVHRLPILDNNGDVVGIFGMVIYKDTDELISMMEMNHLLKTQLKAYQDEIKNIYKAKYTFEDIIGESQKIKEKKIIASRYAKSDSPILITGETGTGKELWAHAIHNISPKKDYPFVSVNCAAIPENLFESELFGYEEGAFTGAKKGGKIGKFQLAKGGTLFLDEIGDMPLNMQVKILRALQEKEIEKVGGTIEEIDFRLIAATNIDLKEAISKNKFREDLYFRINVFNINLPPLRSIPEDTELLIKHYVTKYCNTNGKIKTIDIKAIESLKKYSWPGNTRQLFAVLERLLVGTDSPIITIEDLPQSILLETNYKLDNKDKNKLDNLLAQVEKESIIKALSISKNKSEAAQYLGIARSRLYRRLKEYKIMD